MRKYTHLQL